MAPPPLSNPDTVYPWLRARTLLGNSCLPARGGGKMLFHILELSPAPHLYSRQPRCVFILLTAPAVMKLVRCVLATASVPVRIGYYSAFAPSVVQRPTHSFLSAFCNRAYAAAWINLLPCLRTVVPASLCSQKNRTEYLAGVMQTVVVELFLSLPNGNQTLVLDIDVTFISTFLGVGGKQQTVAKSCQRSTLSLIFHDVSDWGIQSLDPPASFTCLTLVAFCPDQISII